MEIKYLQLKSDHILFRVLSIIAFLRANLRLFSILFVLPAHALLDFRLNVLNTHCYHLLSKLRLCDQLYRIFSPFFLYFFILFFLNFYKFIFQLVQSLEWSQILNLFFIYLLSLLHLVSTLLQREPMKCDCYPTVYNNLNIYLSNLNNL